MASENGHDGALVIPPTIQALLQARLDRLSAGEREVVGCGAVEGQVFHGTAVEMLADDPCGRHPRATSCRSCARS